MTVNLIVVNAVLVLGLMTSLWLVSVVRRDASIVDPWWSIAFLLVTANTARTTGLSGPKIVLLVMVSAWALRLWLHLLLRSVGKPEDPRYAAFRRRYGEDRYWWISYFQVFLLQGALVVVISAPLQSSAGAAPSGPLSGANIAGLIVFTVGFAFEVVADAQLEAFRRDPERKSGVLESGLWRYSRHPNYFGEALLWWGFWIYSLDRTLGWLTVFAPLLMTFLLVKVSGVAMLDAHLSARKPGFADYVRRTSSFIPRAPRS